MLCRMTFMVERIKIFNALQLAHLGSCKACFVQNSHLSWYLL
jgi:hypothetical protein